MRETIDLINLGEVEVFVEDTGPEQAPAVVVLHGGPGDSSYVLREGFGEELSDLRVIYLDQRGSGRSPELPEDQSLFTLDTHLEDLEQLRHVLELERWTLVGHGFGSLLALEYARRHPQVSQGVLALNPWFNFPWLAQQIYRASLVLRGMREADIEVEVPEDAERLLAEAFAQTEPKAVFDRLMFPNQHSRMEYEWMAEGSTVVGAVGPGQMFVRNGLWQFDYTPFLMQIHRPTATLVGSSDGTSYPEAQQVADLTGGSLEVIEGAGHYPWIDQPQAFSQALQEALNGLLEN